MKPTAILAHLRRGGERKAVPVAKAIAQFPKVIRPRIEAVAARHAFVADLALSHPALLAALATDRDAARAETVIAAVIAGASLKRASALAGVPYWTRGLPPQAFDGPLPALPDDLLFAWRIGSFLPKDPGKAAVWLKLIAHIHAVADSSVALWLAKALVGETEVLKKYCVATEIGMWAWASQRPDTAPGKLVTKRWSSGMSLKTAVVAATDWQQACGIAIETAGRTITDLWHPPGHFEGLEFVPLATPAAIAEEARAMRHCVSTYAETAANGGCRLWSVRRNGERVATLEVRNFDHGIVQIGQMLGCENVPVNREVWWVVMRWLMSVDLRAIPNLPKDYWERNYLLECAFMRTFWRAYWQEKRRFPSWLPYNRVGCHFYGELDSEREHLARLERRRLGHTRNRRRELPNIW